jgi:Na+-transporting NADH:ubiquinone oxidoreductase subunit A
VIDAHPEAFGDGLSVISRLTEGRVYVCTGSATSLPPFVRDDITVARFSGPHPAGLVGTHIALLAPLAPGKSVWHLGYQDVIAIGKLSRSGRPWVERIIALGGPMVRSPRLLRTRLGANTRDLTGGELDDGDCRIVAGSVLSGRTASGPADHLGRYHLQLSALADERTSARGRERRRHGSTFYRPPWPIDGPRALTTCLHGRLRAMLPFPSFDRVVPLDILVSPLLRALLVGDCEAAEALGCCELEEEDLALCTFLCPSKNEYGQFLRSALTEIEARESS